MDAFEHMLSVTSSLLGNDTLLPGNKSRPMELSCDEYITYVDELIQVPIQVLTNVLMLCKHVLRFILGNAFIYKV